MPDDDDLLQPQQFEDVTEGEEEEAEQAEPETPEEPKAQEPEPEPKEQTVPLAALQAEREEKRGLKSRLEQIERYLSQQNQKPAPSLQDDPQGYMEAFAAQMAARDANLAAEMSERFARTTHGDDLVNEAFEAAEAAGNLDQFKGKKDAWGDLVKWHKSQKAMKEIGDDPAAYRERLRKELLAEMTAERAKNPANQPTPSLAGETNLGTRTPPAWNGPTPLDDILGDKGPTF